jgi:hypothetical protein
VGLDDRPDAPAVRVGTVSAVVGRLAALAGNRHRGALLRALLGSARPPRSAAPDLGDRREATFRWLCAAQDATPDGGVSGYFDLVAGRWSGSYPETTGYIIPTFLAYADAFGIEEARARALRMADWGCEVQMEDGAVLSGVIGTRVGPAVFNTGQAVFGWISAYEATGEERYASSARRACEWLARQQDPDGAWRRNLSVLTHGPVHTYNGRCAWALAYAARVLGEERFTDAAIAASDWVLAQQNDAGWFAHNAFAEDEAPLLHTISYVIEGLVGVYAFCGEERFLEAALRALDPVAGLWRAGRLRGRLGERWQPAVSWRCPTGDAQIAVMLHRVARHRPAGGYPDVARSIVLDLAAVQTSLGSGSSVRGGVPGSFPVWGEYMRLAVPNWAAKFYLDALMLETAGVDEKSFPGLVAVE